MTWYGETGRFALSPLVERFMMQTRGVEPIGDSYWVRPPPQPNPERHWAPLLSPTEVFINAQDGSTLPVTVRPTILTQFIPESLHLELALIPLTRLAEHEEYIPGNFPLVKMNKNHGDRPFLVCRFPIEDAEAVFAVADGATRLNLLIEAYGEIAGELRVTVAIVKNPFELRLHTWLTDQKPLTVVELWQEYILQRKKVPAKLTRFGIPLDGIRYKNKPVVVSAADALPHLDFFPHELFPNPLFPDKFPRY